MDSATTCKADEMYLVPLPWLRRPETGDGVGADRPR